MATFLQSTRQSEIAVRSKHRRPRGLTLVELLMVSAVMAILATTLAALASTVQVANQQQFGRGLAVQHGQVAIERMERAIQDAHANEQFPGFIIITETVGGSTYPDTLVVWKPDGEPTAPTGMPRVNELVVFTPASDDPTRLVEIRDSSNNSQVPALSNNAEWQYLIDMLKNSASYGVESNIAVLTDLLRVAAATSQVGGPAGKRGCVRFEQALRPSDAQWQAYKAGSTSWGSLPWAQGIYGATVGQRQALCRIELQLRPGDIDSHEKQLAIPFLGSGAIYYQLER
ncbi:MAG: type II secretion system protein [Planctomycetes bacterium]|nr:type II secretion system protein [Planctomycetota bacterium]